MEFHDWTFHGEEREKTIKINQKQMVVSNRSYKTFDEFKADFTEPLAELIQADGQQPVARTGLRFVNIFSGLAKSFAELSEYFHPMISSSLTNLVGGERCARQVQISEYLDETFKMRLQAGIFNPDYPAVIIKFDFVIDLDCYVDTPHLISEVPALVNVLHAGIQSKFEALITDRLREVLNA
jgi:uncharacterized protein (TIGR04255 family)